MTKLTIEELRHCTCKVHYEERAKILYKEGKVICWTAGNNFKEPNHCVVCLDESNEKLKETNYKINEKRMLLIRALDASWGYIDVKSEMTLEKYKITRGEVENG